MIVVPVLITSCQLSLKPNSGPVISQTRTAPSARPKAAGLPMAREAALESQSKRELDLVGRMDTGFGQRHFCFDGDLLRGTFAPARRACDSPIAIACFRLLT